MPFYLRKSVRLGPIRFNLSKSGIGLSGGVTGFRVGVRPNGRSYVHAGRYGLYYCKELGGKKNQMSLYQHHSHKKLNMVKHPIQIQFNIIQQHQKNSRHNPEKNL